MIYLIIRDVSWTGSARNANSNTNNILGGSTAWVYE